MRWDERQLALLREIGVRLWLTPDVAVTEAAVTEAAGTDHNAPATLARPALAAAPKALPRYATASATEAAPESDAAAPAAPAAPSARPERADAVASMDWPALRESAAACTACALCEGRRRPVFGVGNQRAHWMIIGEAPGDAEDAQGEPFVGKAGQLLDNMLHAIGLTRGDAGPAQQVYIAHVVKCRPLGNRNPSADELARCEAYLIRQVQLVQPRIILALGRFAPQLLGSTEPGGKLRGRVHQYHGVPVIVSYGPAHLLRNPEDKARAWDDLCLAAETLQSALPG